MEFIWKIPFKTSNFKETGNYSGIHQEAKAQLKILNGCTNTLLAIVDIKDPERAKEIHEIILAEIDVENILECIEGIKEIQIALRTLTN